MDVDNSSARLGADRVNVTPSGTDESHVTVELSRRPDQHSEGFHSVVNLTKADAVRLAAAILKAVG